MSLINKIKKSTLNPIYKASIGPRANKKLELLLPYLKTDKNILEIGSGNCGLAHLLKKQGFSIAATDIVDNSFYDDIEPIVFSGKELPFKDKSFDVVLLITVLHHTTYQKELLNEAKRLGKKVIVMEDVYTHYFGEKLLKFTDSLVNLEFKGHPHTNRTHEMWVLYFKKVNFEITTVKHIITAGYFRQVIYVLK